jgi:hypothetical protein
VAAAGAGANLPVTAAAALALESPALGDKSELGTKVAELRCKKRGGMRNAFFRTTTRKGQPKKKKRRPKDKDRKKEAEATAVPKKRNRKKTTRTIHSPWSVWCLKVLSRTIDRC